MYHICCTIIYSVRPPDRHEAAAERAFREMVASGVRPDETTVEAACLSRGKYSDNHSDNNNNNTTNNDNDYTHDNDNDNDNS